MEEPQLTDDELAGLAEAGDRRAFVRLHERHVPGLYDFAVRVVRDRTLAAAAVKAAAGEARAALVEGSRPESPKALLYTTLHGAALDALLAGGADVPEDPALFPAAPGGDDEVGEAVWSAAAALAPQDYALLDLHARRDLDADEIAIGLGVARGALALRLEQLRQELGARTDIDPSAAAGLLAELAPVEPPAPLIPREWSSGRRPLLVAGSALLAAVTAGAVLAAQGGGISDPSELGSPSHRIGQQGTNVVAVSWSPQPEGEGYSVLWTRDDDDRPDETVDLPASATGARSPALEPGTWWFVLRTHGGGDDWSDGVRLGPFVVPDAPTAELADGPPTASRSTAAVFRFTASESGAGLECALDGAAFRACESPQTFRGLEQGTHRLVVRATGVSGVAGEPAEFEWTVDTRPPKTRFTREPPSATRSRSARFRFTANERGVSFRCKLDDSRWRACRSPQSLANLTEAPHRFAVKSRDRAGNVDRTPAVRRWVVDRTPPDTAIRGGRDVTGRNARFTLVASESGVGFRCSLDGAPFGSCSSALVLSGLGPGTHTLRVLARDEAGNADATPAEHRWTVDARPPGTLLVEHPPSTTRSKTATFSFSATESGATFQCRLDERAFSPCPSRITYIGLTRGWHVLAVRARDRAGNVDPTPVTWRWRVR